jgi:hypothetical protein
MEANASIGQQMRVLFAVRDFKVRFVHHANISGKRTNKKTRLLRSRRFCCWWGSQSVSINIPGTSSWNCSCCRSRRRRRRRSGQKRPFQKIVGSPSVVIICSQFVSLSIPEIESGIRGRRKREGEKNEQLDLPICPTML